MPDWAYTLIAQIANILVLVFLLRRFLYKPVRDMLAKRRDKVQGDLALASRSLEEAKASQTEVDARLAAANEESGRLLTAAREEARGIIDAAAEQAREAAEQERRRGVEAWRKETSEAERALRGRTVEVSLGLARRMLDSAACPEAAAMMAAQLADHVTELDATALQGQTAGVADDGPPPAAHGVLSTSHEIPPELQERLRQAIAAKMGREVTLETRRDPDLICGAEVEMGSVVIKAHLAQRLDEAVGALATAGVTEDPEF